MDDPLAPGIIEHVSQHPFPAVLERVEAAIMRARLTVFCRIDHAEAARQAGLEMPPSTVLIYGNPKGGTPIMVAAPRAALDLPLRVLIRQGDDGNTVLAFHPIADTLRRAGASADLAQRLAPAQALLLGALA
jgi:uncharacterized protein (DUF302 family)